MSAAALTADRLQDAFAVAAAVPDPELPALTLGDLGIVRGVSEQDGTLIVRIAPTYSGCPAMREILLDVRTSLQSAGYEAVEVRLQLQPPWTTDWITDEGRRKLAAAGIAPPHPAPRRSGAVPVTLGRRAVPVACPSCGSTSTREQSHFGATACRALYRCERCAEPFEYLKEL